MGNPSTKNKSAPRSSTHDFDLLNRIALRAHYSATRMIQIANNRPDKEKGDPKVGGHASASASALHILGSLHLAVKSGFDHMAVKPHASPTDHSYNFLLDLFLDESGSRLPEDAAVTAMHGLRKFSRAGEPVFQSYHSAFDPDRHNFCPSGTVGIPPVNAGYLALAYRYAQEHGYEVPEKAHFWALIGDSEFREGSLLEAMPDFAEREIGNLTWIVDYNRQSLDGHRIVNESIYGGKDCDRIEKTFLANGWEVVQLRHGKKREALFKKPGGEAFKNWLENEVSDYQFQTLLLARDAKTIREELAKDFPQLTVFVKGVSDDELRAALADLGGHDFQILIEALEHTRRTGKTRPSLIIAHTVKGWGLRYAAAPGNHSALPADDEVDELMSRQGIKSERLFEKFTAGTPEAQYCKERGEKLYSEIQEQFALKERNKKTFLSELQKHGGVPTTLNINTKLASYPHTQWMLGQLTAKLTRIANTPADASKLSAGQKALQGDELSLKLPGELLVSMAPDVGTSTNLNPAMDGKVFGATETEDFELGLNVKDTKLPDLVPGEDKSDRFLRFEIAESNVMSCVGSFGRIRDTLGIPILPLMTVYDFFIKRALDQHFYNLYWKSSFILVGTPSGVTLSPEGAQHGWKSDIQIPNQITWEPFFCAELDWIFADAMKRHLEFDNEGRMGVVIRGVTRGVDQNELLKRSRRQAKYKAESPAALHPSGKILDGALDESQVAAKADSEILEDIRENCLKGAYSLVDYRGYAGYEPGDNVVHIFAMGSLGTEALKASDALLERGIYANVIMVTSSDLLVGNQAYANDYQHIKENLGVDGTLYLTPYVNGELPAPEMMTVSGRRIPIVSVHDGEPGLLDNLGSIIGVRHEALAVRKHSKCGRPSEIYGYHHIDAASIVDAAGKVLSQTALEKVRLSRQALAALAQSGDIQANWSDLWATAQH